MKTLQHIVLGFGMMILPFAFVNAQEVISFNNKEIHAVTDTFNFFNSTIEPKNNSGILKLTHQFYSLGLFIYEFEQLHVGFSMRLEEELPYINTSYIYHEFHYLDLNIKYSLGAFDMVLLFENILGFNNYDVAITPELNKQMGVYNELIFNYDSAFLVSAGLTFNF
jgi:hypothetical protein